MTDPAPHDAAQPFTELLQLICEKNAGLRQECLQVSLVHALHPTVISQLAEQASNLLWPGQRIPSCHDVQAHSY